MAVAWLGFGANLGDAQQTLKDAVACFAQESSVTILAQSSMYRTSPIAASGNDYYNSVVKLETTLLVRHLLALCHRIENQFGRQRPFRNAPRTLDLDILLFYGHHYAIEEPELIVPHPRLTERAFALVPLVEIDPNVIVPHYGRADSFLAAIASQGIEKIESTLASASL